MSRHLRILALSGGGMKGVVTIRTLEHLSILAGRPITELFDFVIGASVGSILTLGLAAGYNATQILEIITINAAETFPKEQKSIGIFSPIYPSSGLDKVLKSLASMPNGQLRSTNTTTIPAAFVFVDHDTLKPVIVFSCSNTYSPPPLLNDLAMASCAAPVFFARKTLKLNDKPVTAIDASLASYNPVLSYEFILREIAMKRIDQQCVHDLNPDQQFIFSTSGVLTKNLSGAEPKLSVDGNDLTIVSIDSGNVEPKKLYELRTKAMNTFMFTAAAAIAPVVYACTSSLAVSLFAGLLILGITASTPYFAEKILGGIKYELEHFFPDYFLYASREYAQKIAKATGVITLNPHLDAPMPIDSSEAAEISNMLNQTDKYIFDHHELFSALAGCLNNSVEQSEQCSIAYQRMNNDI